LTRALFVLQSLAGGGAERVAINIARMVPEVDVHLALFDPTSNYPFNGPVHLLQGDFMSGGAAAHRIGLLARTVASISKLRARLRPDVTVGFTTWPNLVAVASTGPGRTILTSHNFESTNIRGRSAPIVRGLIQTAYPRADHVVAVSEGVRRDLVQHFRVPASRTETIYNTVDIPEVTRLAAEPLPDELAFLEQRPFVLSAGRAVEQKGLWHLVRAFADRHSVFPSARLVFIGGGPLVPYLIDLARSYGLRVARADEEGTGAAAPADVVFLGFQKNPFAFMARARAVALPSLWEGFGNVIVEALASGTLVLAANCRYGPAEILARSVDAPNGEAEFGVLLPLCDGMRRGADKPLTFAEVAWSDALEEVLARPTLWNRYKALGPPRADEFSIEAVAPRWERVFSTS